MPPLPVGHTRGVSVARSVRWPPHRAALGSWQRPVSSLPRLPSTRGAALQVVALSTGELRTQGVEGPSEQLRAGGLSGQGSLLSAARWATTCPQRFQALLHLSCRSVFLPAGVSQPSRGAVCRPRQMGWVHPMSPPGVFQPGAGAVGASGQRCPRRGSSAQAPRHALPCSKQPFPWQRVFQTLLQCRAPLVMLACADGTPGSPDPLPRSRSGTGTLVLTGAAAPAPLLGCSPAGPSWCQEDSLVLGVS